ncbi:hypothetical protein Nepgr_003368 [Nepenthes gracilis]|uniref:SHSP domain-containing protein n=1 Tax=Nepenthes gracilis TaxID=150966 RepID=A0AAD3XDG3_NEPGR|nr:hypothetical protein Nepgr_003368 [Nepenthes gracilis]
MSHSVCNLSSSLTLYPSDRIKLSSSVYERFPHFHGSFRPNGRCCRIKSMAAERVDNLDHLQRASGVKPQQPQIKRRTGQVAPIGLWDRFPTARTVQQMMDTMERMIEDPLVFNGAWPSRLTNETGGYARGRTPWEIKEGENEYKMRFDMPGMTKDDVKVWVEEKMLVVKAEKAPRRENERGSEVEEEDEGDWSAKSYGRYNTRIALPENVEFEQIKAEVKDGVLYITVPKAGSSNKILDISVR